MYDLKAYLLFSFLVFWAVLLSVSNIFKYRSKWIWFCSAFAAGVATFIFGILGLSTPFLVMVIGSLSLVLLVVLVMWITGQLK